MHVVVGRIQVVEHHLRQRVLLVEPVEVAAERVGLRPVADGIEAGVRPDFAEAPRVVVAPRAQVKLLGPALLGIQAAEEQHQVAGETAVLLGGRGVAAARARPKIAAASGSVANSPYA